ncbi:MAG: molybdate ABC transporter substrate-binding protein [Rhodopila sp.]|nr:molybdate ABC transporter substrate-binding protein [Rhodopila sp.]
MTVLAASNLMAVLDPLARAFGAEHGIPIRVIYGPSQDLEARVEHRVKADIFFPVGRAWMDQAQSAGLIRAETRVDLVASHLALLAPRSRSTPVALGDGMQLAPLLGARGRLSICNPSLEDSGRYSVTALKAMGLWDAVAGRLNVAISPKAELASLGDGQAALAVAFDTDAAGDPAVKVVGEIPDGTHPPIVYPIALTPNADQEARAFLAYLRTPEAARTFRQSGYVFLLDTAPP